MQLGYHSITWGGVVGHAQGVTSAKDLYYLTYGSMEEAVRDIAAAGYTGTEMFDGNLAAYADRPEELRGLLAENGVELVSVYTGAGFVYPDVLPDELDKVRRAASWRPPSMQSDSWSAAVRGGPPAPLLRTTTAWPTLLTGSTSLLASTDSRRRTTRISPRSSKVLRSSSSCCRVPRLPSAPIRPIWLPVGAIRRP